MKEVVISYDPADEQAWRRGDLQDEWFGLHEGLFDAADLRLAKSQTDNHFVEWCAAIHFARQGYHSLLEKYELKKSHKSKYEIFIDRLGTAGLHLIEDLHRGNGLPDLFVYRLTDRQDWFFVETKRAGERILASQKRAFEMIENRFGLYGRHVLLVARVVPESTARL